jgi:signal transduction histidine kinase
MSTRLFGVGFFLVVVLLTGSAAFTLATELRTNEQVDKLVSASLERERLIGLIRLDAALLSQAVDDHINAAGDTERASADKAMDVILAEIRSSTERYAAALPKSEAELWRRFTGSAEALVDKVDVTIKYSNRREAERARKLLEEEIKPLYFALDDTGGELARRNAEETRRVLQRLEDLRLRSTALTSVVVGVAVVLSVIIGVGVVQLLRRQQRTISQQLAELDRRNQELDAFASRVAHDLISPLAPLKGFLTLARRQSHDPAVQELLAQAESSTSRMSELVEALLRFCRAVTPVERANGELDTAVSTVLLEAAQAAEAHGVSLARMLEAHVAVGCPPQLLASIAQNLISNALKYTAGAPGAHVAVAVRRERGQGVLEVKDNGRGMAPAVLAGLFQPFFRAPDVKQLPGYGLGLATTKRLVEAHGGTLAVASAPGTGSTFTVRFPLLAASTHGNASALQPGAL